MVCRLRGELKARLKRLRLDSHVRKHVYHSLLDFRIRRCRRQVVVGVKAPGPEDRAGTEDECTTGGAIEREVVGSGVRPSGVAIVEEKSADRQRRGGEIDRSEGTGSVVWRLVPFVAKVVLHKRRSSTHRSGGDSRVTPEAQQCFAVRDLYGVGSIRIDLKFRASRAILKPAAIPGRTERRVAPSTCPLSARVDRALSCFLVGDKAPVGRVRAINARRQPRLPVHLVAP